MTDYRALILGEETRFSYGNKSSYLLGYSVLPLVPVLPYLGSLGYTDIYHSKVR